MAHEGGRLVLQSIVGGDDIIKIGGKGNNYNLDGEQLPTRCGEDDGYWGRVEISPEVGNKTDTLLNVLYATDAENDIVAEACAITGGGLVGAVIGKIAAVFSEEYERRCGSLSFTTHGEGSLTCYVSGVRAGEWCVCVGEVTLTARATEEGGLLRFTAPSGAVSIVPVN